MIIYEKLVFTEFILSMVLALDRFKETEKKYEAVLEGKKTASSGQRVASYYTRLKIKRIKKCIPIDIAK